MKAAGIREVKAHFSRYLREVQQGEVLLVTDRGRVVAEIRKPALGAWPVSSTERSLMTLADRGELRMGDPRRPVPPRLGVALPADQIDAWLDDLRGDGS